MTTYQKGRPVVKVLQREESDWIMSYLDKRHKLERESEWNSIDVALTYSKYFSYDARTKEQYYADRFFQNYWTIHLRYLRETGNLEYKAGIIRLKTKDL